jgi:carbon monoxide dehydrogenase subunit G
MKTVTLRGKYLIKAPKEKVYEVISDFERAPELFPSVAKSMRILGRDGNNLKIEATTKASKFSKTFKVRMDTQLDPPNGFHSINTSSVGVEDETVRLVETAEGTIFDYENTMEITNRFVWPIANLFIGKFALEFWEVKYIKPLKNLLENDKFNKCIARVDNKTEF